MDPGKLKARFRFEQRSLDSAGRRLGAWDSSRAPVSAHVKYLQGSEPVMQQRLNGVQPVVITIRDCAAARLIEPSWRAYDLRRAVGYDIKGVKPSETPGYLEVTAVSEGGNG